MVAGSLTTVVRDTASNEWHSSRFTFEQIALPYRPVMENNKAGQVARPLVWSGLFCFKYRTIAYPGKNIFGVGPGTTK